MELRGTNQELTRPFNRRIVLEYIRSRGLVARSEIAAAVGLTVQTVSLIVRELEDLGFVQPLRDKQRGRGAPRHSLRVNPEGGFAIGIDLSPLGISAALMDLSGQIVGASGRSGAHLGPEAGLRLIADLIGDMRALRADGRILGIGLSIPGPVDVASMSFVGPTTLEGWGGIRLRERVAEESGLPTFIGIDTGAAALGERLYGVARNLSDFYYLHMGMGLGGTMVHAGVPLRGACGNAGEIGHIPMVPGGLPCSCGNRGCLERYVSLVGFEERPAGQSQEDWIAAVTPMFHRAITVIENLFDPETIVLGGIAPAGLIDALVATTAELPSSIAARPGRVLPRVIASTDRQSVLRGAAALAVSGVLSPGTAPSPGDPFSNGLAA